MWGGTFHSIANRLLRRHATAVGLSDGFTVLDQSDASGLFGLLRAESGFADGKTRFPRKETIAAIYSRAVNAQEKLATVLDERFPWCRDSWRRTQRDLPDVYSAQAQAQRCRLR